VTGAMLSPYMRIGFECGNTAEFVKIGLKENDISYSFKAIMIIYIVPILAKLNITKLRMRIQQ
jgi:hypothetical protein